jgi:hypothetical protein
MDFDTENIISIDEKKAVLLQRLQEQDWEEFRERKREFISTGLDKNSWTK